MGEIAYGKRSRESRVLRKSYTMRLIPENLSNLPCDLNKIFRILLDRSLDGRIRDGFTCRKRNGSGHHTFDADLHFDDGISRIAEYCGSNISHSFIPECLHHFL